MPHPYREDPLLRSYLRRALGADVLAQVAPDLDRFAGRCVGDILAMARDAERDPPRHVPYDAWGRRVDRIETARGWRDLDRVSAEEGLVAIGYERGHGERGELARIVQAAKLYLFTPSSAIYTCPLAMSDGAARVLELVGNEALRERALARLTSRDPAVFWTSGQWMTERTGGSDVGDSETVARRDPEAPGGWRLYGDKWFTSATTSQMTMTLARVEEPDGATTPGSRGLSLFYVELRDGQGADAPLRNIRINRLKDKLGTKALPTAELTLDGTPATLLGEPGRGVATISLLFNLTRIYNSVAAASLLGRGVALAHDYAGRRMAFGRLLRDHPLHAETMADLESERAAAMLMAFRLAELQGREEVGIATTAEAAALRLLTPVVKLYTAKQAVAGTSEVLECFGGAGYVEDTGLPVLLRDAQVLSIWEGTTNILSLDALRAIATNQAWEPLMADLGSRLAAVHDSDLVNGATAVQTALQRLAGWLKASLAEGAEGRAALERGARRFAYGVARCVAGTLLLDQAQWAADQGDAQWSPLARRWCQQDLAPLSQARPPMLPAQA